MLRSDVTELLPTAPHAGFDNRHFASLSRRESSGFGSVFNMNVEMLVQKDYEALATLVITGPSPSCTRIGAMYPEGGKLQLKWGGMSSHFFEFGRRDFD
jgi:hypothetical protein